MTVAVSNTGCHTPRDIHRSNSTVHVIKRDFEITYYMYIAMKAKCKHADSSMWNLIQIPQVLLAQGSVLGSS